MEAVPLMTAEAQSQSAWLIQVGTPSYGPSQVLSGFDRSLSGLRKFATTLPLTNG
jgi:hypothetical protein